ncbi:MAG: exodeoxyribonuclease VII large subunit, partial [Candidatus Cybelea sp.]
MKTSVDDGGAKPASVVVTVSEFSERLKEVFRRVHAFEYIGISGEISEWTPRPNGVYFTLKDAQAVLQCFAHHSRAQAFPELPRGSAIVAYGKVRLAQWRSRYELVVDSIELTGIGILFKQYEELKARFRALGFFERSRKRRVPSFPNVVALVSASGKGAEDFLKTMEARAPRVRVRFIETRVQGLGADVEIAEALGRAAALNADVIVLARGGGSYEDLFAFNCEPVVRAIMRSKTPVVTGIGHTADHHLADEVADFECETPSNAAQFIAGLWQAGEERLARLRIHLVGEMREILTDSMQRADRAHDALLGAWQRAIARRRDRFILLDRSLSAHNPVAKVARQAERFMELKTRLIGLPPDRLAQLRRAVDARLERLESLSKLILSRRESQLALASGRLFSSDPEKPLERGYAIVTRAGRALRSATEVSSGEAIEARLFHGT